jgi:CheY-like chemotaxis protein
VFASEWHLRPILVVEDHDEMREVITEALSRAGYRVTKASNGRQALDLMVSGAEEEPCLIVLDLDMPVMSGWELLAIIRAYRRLSSIPVLITSGSERASDEALRHGAVLGCLTKPVDVDALLEQVDRVTTDRRAEGSV